MSLDDLILLLSKLFENSTEQIKEATKILKDYFRSINSLENLLILMSTSQNTNIRQVSCIFLRKIIVNLWMHLSNENKQKTKTLLLQRFVEEPVTLIKKNIADVIG